MSSTEQALQHFNKALSQLETLIERLSEQPNSAAVLRKELSAMIDDRAKLAGQLDAALSREKDLRGITDDASSTLGSAITEIRSVLKHRDKTDG